MLIHYMDSCISMLLFREYVKYEKRNSQSHSGVCRESEFPPTEELNASAELGPDVDKNRLSSVYTHSWMHFSELLRRKIGFSFCQRV